MTDGYSHIKTFITSVAAVAPVTPRVVRVTVAGGDLTSFEPLGPDQFVYVLLPPPGTNELTIDASFTWEHWGAMPDETRPVGAYYTVRHWRPERAELDLDFVLHDGGVACEWARTATVGDPVALWGPRLAYEPPEDLRWQLVVADDTGLPAVAAILESSGSEVRSRVVIEVADHAEEQPLPVRDGIEVTWLHRNGVAAGKSHALVETVRDLEIPREAYVWGGGESRIMTAIRKHVRQERGLERDAVSLVGYWRHSDHLDDPVDAEE
jgi:NADPH-dependent ferric siderophore reductase